MKQNRPEIKAIIAFLDEQGYASLVRLKHEFGIQKGIQSREFKSALDSASSDIRPLLGRVEDDSAAEAVLCRNVYYSTAWLSQQEYHFGESVGEKIGYDFYYRIAENNWNQYNGMYGTLDYDALSNAGLDYIMRYDWKCKQYHWRQFQWRYGWTRNQIENYRLGLARERQEAYAVDDIRAMYRRATDYPPAQYRLAKLLKKRIGDDYQNRPMETRQLLDLLNNAKVVYLPAAFLLGIMYEGLGRMEQASGFYSQAAALREVTWGRDGEVALCLAIMYRDGHGVQKNQYEANRYFGVAQELGNVEAGQLLEQFEFLGR